MSPVPRRCAALACIAALALLTGCSTSGSGSGEDGTTTTGLTPITTASRERVRVVGAQNLAILRPLLARQRASCGRDGIAPVGPAAVAQCRKALTDLARVSHDFARALVFLRPAPELEPIVADTIDALRPVIDTIRVYPKNECLGTTAPSAATRTADCTPLGREVAETISLLEPQLDRWKVELDVG